MLGFLTTYDYDEKNRIIYEINSNGTTRYYLYDSFGNITHGYNITAKEYWVEYEYNESGKIIKETIYTRF